MVRLQCLSVRFEKRGREFTSVVRLSSLSCVAGAKANARSCESSEGQGAKAPEITGVRPEARRSNPGQGEALRKQGGSLIGVVSCQSLP